MSEDFGTYFGFDEILPKLLFHPSTVHKSRPTDEVIAHCVRNGW